MFDQEIADVLAIDSKSRALPGLMRHQYPSPARASASSWAFCAGTATRRGIQLKPWGQDNEERHLSRLQPAVSRRTRLRSS